MRYKKGRLIPLRGKGKKHISRIPRKLTPAGYVLRETWRNRSRTLMSMIGIAALTLLFILFSSMDSGLDSYFQNDQGGEPSKESKELFKVKLVMDDWIYLITVLCWSLIVLTIANTAAITVIERRFELASLRAFGISSLQVSMLVSGSMLIIITGGLAAGLIVGLASVPLLDGVPLIGGGVNLPLRYDTASILYTIVLGFGAGLLGMIPPLVMINRSSPMEVLRNA